MPEGPGTKKPMVGVFVLETLTTGMYTNPLDTLREYIQNSFDSIREAERTGALAEGEGRIEVTVHAKERNLTIRDNGIGIGADAVYSRLVNIGMSHKSAHTDAGFRGIGRLAGIAYCRKLVFSTQGIGETSISSVTFDCEQLRRAMLPRVQQHAELADVLAGQAIIGSEKARKKAHYCEVRMEGINDAGQQFLEWKQVHTYLCQTAPVGLDTQSFHHAGTIHEWLKNHRISIPTVSIVIISGATNYQVFKPYRKLTYTTAQEKHKVHIGGIRLFPDDAGAESPYWGWYAETNCPGTVGDDTVAGFRLRKANIGIGGADRMTEIFAEASESYARFNKYFIGEIHVQDVGVIPNARRDGFEDSLAWQGIRNALIAFARERSREAHECSKARNWDVERLIGTAEREREDADKKRMVGLASKDEQVKVLERIDRQLARLEAAANGDRKDTELRRIARARETLQHTREAVTNETTFAARHLNTSLDRKQRRIISEIIAILYSVLDEEPFARARDAILTRYRIADEESTQ